MSRKKIREQIFINKINKYDIIVSSVTAHTVHINIIGDFYEKETSRSYRQAYFERKS